MEEKKALTAEEREEKMKELGRRLDTLIVTASEENFEGEELDAILKEFIELNPLTEEQEAMFDPEKGLERLNKRIIEIERYRYTLFYDLVVAEEKRIKNDAVSDNYKLCKALAACYELQDYLSNRLVEYPEETSECAIKS